MRMDKITVVSIDELNCSSVEFLTELNKELLYLKKQYYLFAIKDIANLLNDFKDDKTINKIREIVSNSINHKIDLIIIENNKI